MLLILLHAVDLHRRDAEREPLLRKPADRQHVDPDAGRYLARAANCLPPAAGVLRRIGQQVENRWSPEPAEPTLYAMEEPHRRIRALHTASTITVYQAYRPEIGGPAARKGRFPAAWKPDRMTWIIKQRSQTFAAV
ncbi:hypothetical protein GCM10023335_60970 [Streptomyces siamensis]|uniref:DUF4291 domain-containing protein n=1 Tax=Streptomyces siamensis TaxID=1274986 RepID=A0ABP9JAD4_9ACTN